MQRSLSNQSYSEEAGQELGRIRPDKPAGGIYGSGTMAELVRAHDWSSTPLGSIESWSEALLCNVNMMLALRFPCIIFWGPEMVQFYNDAYLPMMSEKHPSALGQSGRECWKEAWAIIGPQFEAVLASGETTYRENVIVPVVRDGRLSDVYWTYSYSPLFYPSGEIGGILIVCHDTTEQVLATHRLQESEARANRILHSIGDAVIVTSADGCITRMNPIAESLTGWTMEDAKGRSLGEVFHIVDEASRRRIEDPASKARRLGVPAELGNHTILVAKDGRETYIDDSAAPIRNDEGMLTGIVLVFRDITKRRETERERDALGKELRQILDATTDGVLSLDRNWQITYLNNRGKAILSTNREILGKDFWQAFPGTVYDGSPYVKHYTGAMIERISGEFEAFYPEPLNAWFTVQVQPSVDGIIIFFRDVTESRREAAALRESEARLSAIYSTSAAYIGLLTPDGRVIDCNRAALGFAGNTHEEVRGIRFWDGPWFQYTPGAPELVRQAAELAAAGEIVRHELPLTRPSGEVLTFDFSLSPVYDSDGNVLYLVPEAHDISSLKSTQRALAISQEELHWTVELSAPIPWTADTDGNVLEVSRSWLELTGLTREQALAEGWMQVTHPDDVKRSVESWGKALESGEPYEAEHRIRTASGEYRFMCSRAFPRRDETGRIVKWYGTLEDIEERKRAEYALVRSEKLAAVGRLAASIAHEINNPLEAVFNLLYLASRTSDVAEIQSFIATSERELRRVSAITNQTLRFYKQSSSPRAVHAHELIDSVLGIYQGRIVNAKIEVLRRERAANPVMCFDGEIRQVLLNLVGNAIDSMNTEGGRLLIRTREATEWKHVERGLVFTVADTGCGIDPQILSRIFEAFFTTKGLAGTGLGLWVSKEIVVRHHGVLRVRSSQTAARRGTVMTLFLPFEAVSREVFPN